MICSTWGLLVSTKDINNWYTPGLLKQEDIVSVIGTIFRCINPHLAPQWVLLVAERCACVWLSHNKLCVSLQWSKFTLKATVWLIYVFLTVFWKKKILELYGTVEQNILDYVITASRVNTFPLIQKNSMRCCWWSYNMFSSAASI